MKNSLYLFSILSALNSSTLNSAPAIMPFHNVDGYIMINGSVNEKYGLLMLDTGTPFEFLLNSNSNKLASDEFVAAGNAGSGQPISIYRQKKSVIIDLFHGILKLERFNIVHADLEFIQRGVSQCFTGMIGKGFLKKPFSIDYKSQVVTIYEKLPLINSDYIKFSITQNPLPEIQITIGEINMTGFFDTGNLGTLTLNKKTESILIESHRLTLETFNTFDRQLGSFNIASLSGVSYNQNNLGSIEQLRYELGDLNRIGLGYSFLKKYISIWDLENDTLYLLPNR
ncbi:MAG: hypothetical protein ACRCVV_09090 [Shewanella sp.]